MKQRRVGTFTLGISLILLGAAIPLGIINKTYCLRVVQFAPLLLVALGVEILIFAIFFKNDKLKYDGLSIFMVIAITIVSMAVGTVAPAFLKYTEMYKNEMNAADEVREELYRAAKEENLVAECRAYVSTDEWELFFADNPELEYHAEVDLRTDKVTDNTSRKEIVSIIYDYLSEVEMNTEGLSYIRVMLSGRNTERVVSHKVVVNDERLKALTKEAVDYDLLTDIDIGRDGDYYVIQIDYYGRENYEEKLSKLKKETYPTENGEQTDDIPDEADDTDITASLEVVE